jgi:hypothetical protein
MTCPAVQQTLKALTGRVLLGSTDVDELLGHFVDLVDGFEVSPKLVTSGID